jgi:hypothetical protein
MAWFLYDFLAKKIPLNSIKKCPKGNYYFPFSEPYYWGQDVYAREHNFFGIKTLCRIDGGVPE